MPIDPGTQVGRFRIVRLVAQGGMAEVYRAEQEMTTGIFRPAALKVIRPEYAASEDFREMFLDEARTACTLSHPNIVHIYEVGEAEGLLYMGMELVAGESLATVGKELGGRGHKLTEEALIAIGAFTCSALEAVHALKVGGVTTGPFINLVHRDVSPHNLLLSPNGSLKLIDFGIAKAATNRNLTNVGVTKGKAGYFSPEQAVGLPLDGRSDLFSLGVTLYKLASGVTPFEEHQTHHDRHSALVAGRWKPLQETAPGLLQGFYTIVGKALQVRREDRYQSAAEMREELEALAYDAGMQVGQASLAGYVEELDGEVSIPNAPRHSGTHLARRRTMETQARGGRSYVPWVAAGAAVMLAATATAWALRPSPAPAVQAPQPPPSPIAAAPAPAPTPAAATPAPAPLVLSTTKARGERGESHKRATPPKAETPRPPPAETEVLSGKGKVRVGTAPQGGQVTVASKSLGDKSLGEAPVDITLPSGPYTVEISWPELHKKNTCLVRVLPDKTARVKGDAQNDRCSAETN
ncbi:MAG TPA: serine/threonine-protein kinase [Myxococcaceae bacterium]